MVSHPYGASVDQHPLLYRLSPLIYIESYLPSILYHTLDPDPLNIQQP